ncbi:hypothetical protein [Marinilactibacillus psychrotolerans]|uniref:Permease n=1 Tax=Marinilactibacillus psychrotolerans TaxID=191770 RepID=A0AAV3WRH4_9LACT|nr:hypothetical protein [Marinilactibacillus psychrotolerans]GEL66818.1 hypothetical protein MPS01_09730 [Marinilactibacillus psychrotolerans]GEQ35735.1 hypothetical protein M132T_12430 [Marinilactibacillus psychrotolerans]SDC35715.1 hypothetical protein SAMN04488013_104118 [Marinilactibacillus psychrotolerans]
MARERKKFLLENFLVYLGCIFVGAICNTFLDFNDKFDNNILFLILPISGVLLSLTINFLLRKNETYVQKKNNKRLVMLLLILIIVLRLFPTLYPKSMVELVIFLTVIFILVILQDLIPRKNS